MWDVKIVSVVALALILYSFKLMYDHHAIYKPACEAKGGVWVKRGVCAKPDALIIP
jgi:hypothetical protein